MSRNTLDFYITMQEHFTKSIKKHIGGGNERLELRQAEGGKGVVQIIQDRQEADERFAEDAGQF